MSDLHASAEHPGATAVVVEKDHEHRLRHKVFHYTPAFLYLLVAYVILKLAGFNVRAVIFGDGGYALTWVEILQLVASLIAMMELLKVSHPGVNNTMEVIAMLGIWIVYLLFFVLGAAGVRLWFLGFSIFSSTEFLMLTIISGFQVIAGFLINARTLERTISDSR
jgi:hypothetical protein